MHTKVCCLGGTIVPEVGCQKRLYVAFGTAKRHLGSGRFRHGRGRLTPELSAPLTGAMTKHFIVHGRAPASC
jgi:hypothetical protein